MYNSTIIRFPIYFKINKRFEIINECLIKQTINPHPNLIGLSTFGSYEGSFTLPFNQEFENNYQHVCETIKQHYNFREIRFIHENNMLIGFKFKNDIICWTQLEVDAILNLLLSLLK